MAKLGIYYNIFINYLTFIESNSDLEKSKQKYEEMELKLEQKYSEMSKDIAMREREREMEYLQKKQDLDERDDRLKQMYTDFDSTKEKEMMEISKKIKTTHELIKTVMHLHQDDISNFDGVNISKDSHPPNFSFDITKQVKINESQNSNQDSEEKDKIIIREPLEVFEIEDEMKQMISPDKDSFHDSHDDDRILKAYQPGDRHSRNSDSFPNVFMSPKFKSFEDSHFNGEKLNIDSSNKKSTDNSRDDQLQSQRFSYGAMDFDNESSNQRDIRKKSRVSHLKHPESPEEDEELDYKARLRQSLMASSKPKPSKMHTNQEHDNIDSANSSENAHRKNEHSNSPLNENYNDFEEFTTNYKKKQQEILNEFNSINQNNFHLVNQLANNLNSEDEGEQHSQNSVRMSNKEIEFDAKVTLTSCLTIYLGWTYSLRY